MNMNTKKNTSSPAAITFYVMSVILLVVFAFNIYYAYSYVASFEVSFADEWETILSIYSQQCTASFVGAVLAYGIGYIINKLQAVQTTLSECIEEAIDNTCKEEAQKDDEKVEPEVKEEPKVEEPKEENEKPTTKKKKAEPKKKTNSTKEKTIKEEITTEEIKAEEITTEKIDD